MPTPERRNYLVIGIYDDDNQRFAEDVWAKSPQEAEELIKFDHPGLIVAGVLRLKEAEILVLA